MINNLVSSTNKLRKGVNTIVENKIYQRGQVMSWSLAEKRAFFEELNIGMVVNFWSKLDADMSECGVQYIYAPTPHSRDMLTWDKELLAAYVAKWLNSIGRKAVLILCEAGKTRSVYFSVLVLSHLQEIPHMKAWMQVQKAVRSHAIKDFMLESFLVRERVKKFP